MTRRGLDEIERWAALEWRESQHLADVRALLDLVEQLEEEIDCLAPTPVAECASP